MHYIDNKKTPTMINSWYLNGFNKQTLISGEDSSFPLFLDKLNITAKVEFISYVSQSKRLFFVVPEFPNRIYSCFIGEYLSEIQPNFITFEEGENDIISIENISGKIIAFASSSKHLFFLTCNIGRRGTESSYTLHMYDTDQETGFGMERIESIVDFPDLLPINNKPFCFSVAERRIGGGYRIYFYGEGLNGTIMFANFSSQPKINPRLLKLKKIFGEIPKINFVHSIDNSKQKAIKSLKPSTLLVVDATQNHIYIINHYKENEVKMIPLGRIAPKDTDITITAVSRLKFFLKEQKINSKNLVNHSLLLFAEEKSNSIYSLSLDNTETIYHVIGGGEKNIGENEFRNFRKYRISSSLNNIVSIENFGFIAGESATNNWFAILLPNAIKEKKTSNLCQKYVPHASFSDDYSS